MEALEKQYAPYGMTLQAKEGTPYFLAVNRDANVVTVYTADEDGRYTVPFMAMVCSGGVDTPAGLLCHAGGLRLAAADGPQLWAVRHTYF